jgi:RNA polymerase sigma-70 factor (ECF subfamily)
MSADLVRQAQRGDHAAFETIIGAAYDRLYAIAYRILRDRTAAEDAVVRCWRDLRGLREPDRFEAWLHRLLGCRNHSVKRAGSNYGTLSWAPATAPQSAP